MLKVKVIAECQKSNIQCVTKNQSLNISAGYSKELS